MGNPLTGLINIVAYCVSTMIQMLSPLSGHGRMARSRPGLT